jgi:hypothetical protein
MASHELQEGISIKPGIVDQITRQHNASVSQIAQVLYGSKCDGEILLACSAKVWRRSILLRPGIDVTIDICSANGPRVCWPIWRKGIEMRLPRPKRFYLSSTNGCEGGKLSRSRVAKIDGYEDEC